MNEFNKKYLQIAKQYNYKPNEIIEENIFSDAWNWTKEKISNIGDFFKKMGDFIKKGENAVLKVVQGWFDNADTAQSGKNAADLAANLIKMEDKLPVSEGAFDWFINTCNDVKSGVKLMKSDDERKKFQQYLKNEKKLSDDKLKNLSYIDCKNYLKEFTKKEIPQNGVIQENKQIITEATLIGVLVVLLIVLIVAYYIYTKVMEDWNPTAEQQAKKQIADREAEIWKDEKMEELDKRELTNLLKGCDALK